MTGGQMDNVRLELFGSDPKIQKAISVSRNVAVTKAPVLIVGEAGTGKKCLGRFIHENSNRAQSPLKIIDCSEDAKTVENNILGYRDEETQRFHNGGLEEANGGSIILANVDSLEEEFQKRLHKILQELEDYDIDVRVIATTTKNLSKLVGAGRFYRGLYTLISNNSINLTPLRERVQDLNLIAEHFVNQFSSEMNRPFSLSDSARNKILSHYWTYNVHELKTVLESCLGSTSNDVITDEDIQIGEKKSVGLLNDDDSEGIRLMSLKEAEKLLIKKALVHTSENRTQAAKILGVSIRTLRNKINEYRSTGSSFFVNLR
ncbi:MAG: sigma-54-dependent transcriptional regulator [Bacteriovoracaceae bacterium]